MTNIESPWSNMEKSSQRRIDFNTSHNLFWITDLHGNYGFCIQAEGIVINSDNKINLKGISVIKRNSNKDYVELFLILNKKEDWQIFLSLCEDLISVTKKYDTDEKMISAVEIRLRRWQQLLKQNRNQEFTIEKQMGLFSELKCLKDVVALNDGIKQAIISWVGPEFDRQDFLMENAAIEVKSHRTSKGEIVQISSLHQLHSEKEPLFLISYALTSSENGLSVEDVSRSIRELLKSESNEIIDLFEDKLIQYGYIPEIIKEPLQKFIVDKHKVFYISNSFPKIFPKDIKSQITSVKYSIDLSRCHEFEVEPKSFLDGSDSYD
jgi:energy-converting hydrogenase A subunit M